MKQFIFASCSRSSNLAVFHIWDLLCDTMAADLLLQKTEQWSVLCSRSWTLLEPQAPASVCGSNIEKFISQHVRNRTDEAIIGNIDPENTMSFQGQGWIFYFLFTREEGWGFDPWGGRFCDGLLLPLRVLKCATRIAIEIHNNDRKQNSIHWEAINRRLSVDMPLFPKTTVPFYSLHVAVSHNRSTVKVADFGTQRGTNRFDYSWVSTVFVVHILCSRHQFFQKRQAMGVLS